MKAEKVTVIIKMEALSIDVLSAMLLKVMQQVDEEAESGSIFMQDGDSVEWDTTRKTVNF